MAQLSSIKANICIREQLELVLKKRKLILLPKYKQ